MLRLLLLLGCCAADCCSRVLLRLAVGLELALTVRPNEGSGGKAGDAVVATVSTFSP
jgi:hypothetical protein